jgi:hypothetical protein
MKGIDLKHIAILKAYSDRMEHVPVHVKEKLEKYKIDIYDSGFFVTFALSTRAPIIGNDLEYKKIISKLTKKPELKEAPKVPHEPNADRAKARGIPPNGRPINLYSKKDAIIINEKIMKLNSRCRTIYNIYNLEVRNFREFGKMPFAMFSYITTNNYVAESLTIEEAEFLIRSLEHECTEARHVPSVETLLTTYVVPLLNPLMIETKKAALDSGLAVRLTEMKKRLDKDTVELHALLKMEIREAENLCTKTLRPALQIMRENKETIDEYHDKCHFYAYELPKTLEIVRMLKPVE